MTIAWCCKCKVKREMKSPTHSKTKNGVPMMKGKCSKCGTTMCRLGAK